MTKGYLLYQLSKTRVFLPYVTPQHSIRFLCFSVSSENIDLVLKMKDRTSTLLMIRNKYLTIIGFIIRNFSIIT